KNGNRRRLLLAGLRLQRFAFRWLIRPPGYLPVRVVGGICCVHSRSTLVSPFPHFLSACRSGLWVWQSLFLWQVSWLECPSSTSRLDDVAPLRQQTCGCASCGTCLFGSWSLL